MVTEITWGDRNCSEEEMKELSEVMEMFYIVVMATGVYTFISHQIVYLRSYYFTIYKLYLKTKHHTASNTIGKVKG